MTWEKGVRPMTVRSRGSSVQALDLGDVDTSAPSPSGVKLRASTPRLPDLDILPTEVSDRGTDRLLMGGRGGIDLVPVHPERVGTGMLRRAARLERPPKGLGRPPSS
jgi:hypothetical protein